ncbi:hypothetical protein LZ554_002506 [Drepanopeziza brunnea f. sp. 'monogermtubi']|nr:hypothetical protein LZ554_002506 [Drepanopeziza brunnea f. sp. 'monogermtubi']
MSVLRDRNPQARRRRRRRRRRRSTGDRRPHPWQTQFRLFRPPSTLLVIPHGPTDHPREGAPRIERRRHHLENAIDQVDTSRSFQKMFNRGLELRPPVSSSARSGRAWAACVWTNRGPGVAMGKVADGTGPGGTVATYLSTISL